MNSLYTGYAAFPWQNLKNITFQKKDLRITFHLKSESIVTLYMPTEERWDEWIRESMRYFAHDRIQFYSQK